jgi:hypothetical protein
MRPLDRPAGCCLAEIQTRARPEPFGFRKAVIENFVTPVTSLSVPAN